MKKAFTLLELIFVIVVIGIIAGTMLPKTTSTSLDEAGVQLLEHIRYTQHLAMVNDQFNSTDDKWYKKRWELLFGKSDYTNDRYAYTIFSDKNSNTKANLEDMAIDVSDSNKYMSINT